MWTFSSGIAVGLGVGLIVLLIKHRVVMQLNHDLYREVDFWRKMYDKVDHDWNTLFQKILGGTALPQKIEREIQHITNHEMVKPDIFYNDYDLGYRDGKTVAFNFVLGELDYPINQPVSKSPSEQLEIIQQHLPFPRRG